MYIYGSVRLVWIIYYSCWKILFILECCKRKILLQLKKNKPNKPSSFPAEQSHNGLLRVERMEDKLAADCICPGAPKVHHLCWPNVGRYMAWQPTMLSWVFRSLEPHALLDSQSGPRIGQLLSQIRLSPSWGQTGRSSRVAGARIRSWQPAHDRDTGWERNPRLRCYMPLRAAPCFHCYVHASPDYDTRVEFWCYLKSTIINFDKKTKHFDNAEYECLKIESGMGRYALWIMDVLQ